MTIISLVNCLFFIEICGSIWMVLLSVVLAVITIVIIDAILAFIVRWILPKKWFSINSTIFTPSKKITRFYEKLGVKKWKDKVPDLGGLTGFRKDKISDPKNNEFVGRYIIEANYGVGVHLVSIVLGFVIVLFYLPNALNILLPVAVVNALINYMSFITLRYNLPKLRTLYKFNARHNGKVSK